MDKILFGIGDMGNGLAMQIVGSYLVFFMTAILHVPGTYAGLAIGFSIAWDAITDPIMGYVSDHTRSRRFGRRHLYIIIGSIGVSFSIIALFFIPPESSLGLKVFLLFLFIHLYKTFITIMVTPYSALGAELSRDYHERTIIQSIRSVFFMLGLSLSLVLGMFLFFQPTAQYPIGQLNPESYRNMALFTVLGTITLPLVTYFATRKYIPMLNKYIIDKNEEAKLLDFFRSFFGTLKNHAFTYVVLAYMFINMGSAFVNNTVFHVFTYTFGFSNNLISFIIGFQFLFSILSQPFWVWLVGKTDKRISILIALGLSILASIYFAFLTLINPSVDAQLIYFLPYALFAGIGTGALFTLPASMVADTIDVEELETGVRTEGVYFGSMTFFYKLSQAITVSIIGYMLDLIRFDSHLHVQSASIQVSLGLILSLGVCISFIFAALSIRKFPLTKASVLEIQQKLKKE